MVAPGTARDAIATWQAPPNRSRRRGSSSIGRAQVGVAEEAVLATGAQHPGAHGCALALVALEGTTDSCGHVSSPTRTKSTVPSRAAVVGDDHLVLLACGVDVLADALQRGRDAVPLVVRRDDHADHRRTSRRSRNQNCGSASWRRQRLGSRARRHNHSSPARRTQAGARRAVPAR